MSIDVRRATAEDRERWNGLVDRSPHGTPFHKLEALDLLEAVTGDECHRFVGYKGQERVGVFPVFLRRKGPVTVAFSPPPGLKITYLGPALVHNPSLKQRKAERRNRDLVEGVLATLDDDVAPRYASVRTHPRYDDPRPFSWNEFRATPKYTYVVSLDRTEDDLFSAFSGDARTNVRDCEDADVTVETGGDDAIRTMFAHLQEYSGPDFLHGLTADFLVDLSERLPDENVHLYVVRRDGEQLAGSLVLESGDTAYAWLGGVKPSCDLPVSDYMDWRSMQDAMDRGIEYFDLVGANVPRLCEYKSKFAPEVRSHIELERGSLPFRAAAELYRRVR